MTDPLDLCWFGSDPADLVSAGPDDAAQHAANILNAARPRWYAASACARPEHVGVDFFPGRGQTAGPALAVCAACPVVGACRDHALALDVSGTVGVWGGTTHQQRKAIRIGRR
jgi:WhiB family transcriptional regulator, redox-sensing transcriptional regulator